MTSVIVWFRQDLRLHDNSALAAAVESGKSIIPIYILDDSVPKNHSIGGAQRWWLHHSLTALQNDLKKMNSRLILKRGNADKVLDQLRLEIDTDGIVWNHCYQPHMTERDQGIKQKLKDQGIDVHSYNSRLLFEPWTILNKSKQFYKVFGQYWKACQLHFKDIRPLVKKPDQLINPIKWPVSDLLEDWQLLPHHPNWAKQFSQRWQPGEQQAHRNLKNFLDDSIDNYKNDRNFPALHGTSRLSPHLHFGEISPHQIFDALQKAFPMGLSASAERYLTEIGWREFSYYLLYHFPKFPDHAFKSKFEHFKWDNDLNMLEKWQQGQTGYPIIDAAMRELWQTGWMHNRMRLIVASFLTKDLFIDWRHGAEWFLDTLVDADLANNTAGWQWIAGCGVDASPYFRIFNPVLQAKKFDVDAEYVRRWVPEIAALPDQYIHEPWLCPTALLHKNNVVINKTYPSPIVDRNKTRIIALSRLKDLKSST